MSDSNTPQDSPDTDVEAALAGVAPLAEESVNAGNPTQPRTIYVHHRTGGFGKFVARLFGLTGWLGFIVCVFIALYLYEGRREYYDTTGGVYERYHSGDEDAQAKVAIITINGVIASGEGYIRHQIDRVRDDESVKAVVLRVNSPGGTVNGSDYVFHHLKRLRDERQIPIVVSMGGMATSGGYYVSMAAAGWDGKELIHDDVIFAEETTTTGSIGVIIPHYDLSGFLDEHKIKNDSIASGDRKQMLSMTKEISAEHRAILRKHVMELYELFKDRIKEGRPAFKNDDSGLNQLATGEMFTARQAAGSGLIDKIGFLENAIDRAIDLADLKESEVRVVRYERPPSLLGDLMGFAQADAAHLHGPDVSDLLDLTTPRAYYLASTLPPLVSSQSAD